MSHVTSEPLNLRGDGEVGDCGVGGSEGRVPSVCPEIGTESAFQMDAPWLGGGLFCFNTKWCTKLNKIVDIL